MPNLLHLYLGTAPGGATAARAQLDEAKALGVTHARFIASGYWPAEMKTGNGWQNAPTAYWAAFDALVDDAEARGVKLVPSLLFHLYLFPDLAQEPVGNLFTPGTNTRNLAEQYVTEVVSRYKSRPGILFWELGNEANLLADLDVSACNVCTGNNNPCGSLAPSLGTPCRRTTADNFFSCNSCRGVSTSQQDLSAFTASIATLVKSLDPSRPFATGAAHPRESAMHLAASPCPSCNWTRDSPAEYEQALARLHPAPVDLVTVHHYPGPDAARFGDVDQSGLALLARANAWAVANGKRLYVGEYGEARSGSVTCGASTDLCGGDAEKVHTRRIMNALVEEDVAYSALWAFEFYQFCAGVPSCHTVAAGEPVLTDWALHDAAQGACLGAADGGACPIGRCGSGVCRAVPLQRLGVDTSGSESAFLTWTNCSACTPGTATRVATSAGGYLRITSNDLPCTSGCQYPGVYARTPLAAATPGHALFHFEGRASQAGAQARLMALDASQAELQAWTVSVAQGSAFSTAGAWAQLPAGTAWVTVRFELPAPNATLDVEDVGVEWQP